MSPIAGWLIRTSSSSPGEMFSPPRTMTSSARPARTKDRIRRRDSRRRVGNQTSASRALRSLYRQTLIAADVNLAGVPGGRLARPRRDFPPDLDVGSGLPTEARAERTAGSLEAQGGAGSSGTSRATRGAGLGSHTALLSRCSGTAPAPARFSFHRHATAAISDRSQC